MKYIRSKKAYEINLGDIDEGYCCDQFICYAESHNKAKSTLLRSLKENHEYLVLRKTSEEVTYLTIPVVRCPKSDLFYFEENEYQLWKIEEIIEDRKRVDKLDEMLNDPNITHCYIYKGGYYRPYSCGYTDLKHRAGVYSIERGVSDAKSVKSIKIIPINIEEHNKMIQDEINELKTRIIKTK